MGSGDGHPAELPALRLRQLGRQSIELSLDNLRSFFYGPIELGLLRHGFYLSNDSSKLIAHQAAISAVFSAHRGLSLEDLLPGDGLGKH